MPLLSRDSWIFSELEGSQKGRCRAQGSSGRGFTRTVYREDDLRWGRLTPRHPPLILSGDDFLPPSEYEAGF
jgi:hypothetical protein